MNIPVTKDLLFQHTQANPGFVQWKNEHGNYGLNFLDSNDATKFVELLNKAINFLHKLESGTSSFKNDTRKTKKIVVTHSNFLFFF
jgi:hypothetical protein